ncbi:hypothetical protein [Dyadobacter pollutisoli]|uniref:Uncharacterized protein n=1 Tax=Dyadobacter pollutisoli TaxID=2910158 RepID=A0A9E8SPB4_9BACT|nr:hypothetical protein [Dyadobacter pollutisoli]WAC14551.1 hypothetical protein ON006_11445 [Dyadobacter pollutisoli]
MKSPEEKIDEALREALKRKFDNFERVPDPSLSEKVWRALNISNSPGIIQQTIILGLLFLIIVTGTLLFTTISEDEKESFVKEGKPFVSKPKVHPGPTEPADRISSKIAVAAANQKSAKTGLTESHVAGSTKASFEKQLKMRTANIWSVRKSTPIKKSETFKKSTGHTVTPIAEFENTGNEVLGITANDLADIPSDSSTEIDVNVNELENRPLHLPQFAWKTDSIISLSKSKERIDQENKNDWAFIVSGAPLRTFQTLTIGQTNGVIYQNFSFPTRISAETLGYKFTAGVEKNGFQLLLNYGRFRQSFKYEIARDEYLLQPDKSGEYRVVRKGTPVEENSVSNLLGLSIKKHIVRKTAFLRNYFGDVGMELNRDLTSGTNMVWINAGFGRELFVDRNTRITFGPYVEYSLMKLRNDKNQFRVQPYQIGLSVGLKYLKK